VPALIDASVALREWRPEDAPALEPVCEAGWVARYTSLPACPRNTMCA
jgi:hypothetical protein